MEKQENMKMWASIECQTFASQGVNLPSFDGLVKQNGTEDNQDDLVLN